MKAANKRGSKLFCNGRTAKELQQKNTAAHRQTGQLNCRCSQSLMQGPQKTWPQGTSAWQAMIMSLHTCAQRARVDAPLGEQLPTASGRCGRDDMAHVAPTHKHSIVHIQVGLRRRVVQSRPYGETSNARYAHTAVLQSLRLTQGHAPHTRSYPPRLCAMPLCRAASWGQRCPPASAPCSPARAEDLAHGYNS